MKPRELIEDLVTQVRTLTREAKACDEAARQWLVTSFPGHTDYFLQLWHAADDRPDRLPKCQQRRSGKR
jgi:hypothetical protein